MRESPTESCEAGRLGAGATGRAWQETRILSHGIVAGLGSCQSRRGGGDGTVESHAKYAAGPDEAGRALGWPERSESAVAVAQPAIRTELFGEAIMTVGGPLHEWNRGQIDAALCLGPFECMPSTIAEAQHFHTAEREGLLAWPLALNGDSRRPGSARQFRLRGSRPICGAEAAGRDQRVLTAGSAKLLLAPAPSSRFNLSYGQNTKLPETDEETAAEDTSAEKSGQARQEEREVTGFSRNSSAPASGLMA